MTAKDNAHGPELGLRAVCQVVLAGLLAQVQHFKVESSMKFKVQEETKADPCRHLQGIHSLTLSQLSPLKGYKYINEASLKLLMAAKPQKQ